MSADRSHEAENDAERERLRALVARLGDDDLRRPMPGGWTIAANLAHAGYWDARAIYWLDGYARGIAPVPYEEENVDAVNDAAKPLCLALPPRDAARLALRLAEEADRKVAALSDELLATIHRVKPGFNLARAIHRKEHLDDVERALKGYS
ncbi:MAG TPA: DinB family protein [Candidatus Limnocylindria bacterium]